MRKPTFAITAVLVLASATFSTSAEAGGCGGGGGFRGYGHGHGFSHRFSSSSNTYYARKRARAAAARLEAQRKLAAKRRQIAAAKTAEPNESLQDVADINPPVPVKKPEMTIAFAAPDSNRAAPAGNEITCKRYIPSAGLTISVPCE